MITKAVPSDTRAIYQIWKTMFAFDDGGSIDYYFKHNYDPNNCYVVRKGNDIVSTLCVNSHVLNLHHKRLKTSLISGVATEPNYRRQGHMSTMVDAVLGELETQELVTLIQAYDPTIYEKFGFEVVYYRKSYNFTRNQIPVLSHKGISNEYRFSELEKMYNEFMSLFTGYYQRDENYFAQYEKQVQAEKSEIIVYRNESYSIGGYMVYHLEGDKAVIDEIIYEDSLAFLKLLNYALKNVSVVTVTVSEAENIERIINTAIGETFQFMMARINDYELFNRLYGVTVSTVKEAFSISKKPLYIHEYW